MSNILNRSQKIIAYVLIVVIVFTAGVFTGRYVQKEEQIALAAELSDDLVEEEESSTANFEVTGTDKNSVSEEMLQNETPDITSSDVAENLLLSGNIAGQESVSSNTSMYKPSWNELVEDNTEKKTLEDRALIQSSYKETLEINAKDRQIIDSNKIDFSNMKITFLGDSITMGKEGQTPYPSLLKEILGVKEAYNQGIGGSTIATMDGVSAMTGRVGEIPKDSDIIIVLGGTNDNFYQTSSQFGFMEWEMKGEGTFCGELQLLMKQFKWLYPQAKVIFLTPPSNSYIDVLSEKNKNLLPLSRYAEAICYIGKEQGFPVVDLYNMNFLNSHDADVLSHFMSDTVHPNSEGNRVLAERVAAEIINRYLP